MEWKKWPLWLKLGLLVPIVVLTIFIIGGFITATLHRGSCLTPPCSAGSGYCPSTFSGCFQIHNNYMALVLELPTRMIFYSSSLMSTFYNLVITYPFDVLDRLFDYSLNNLIPVLENIIINSILYFITGALIGLIIQKIKSKKQ